MNLTQSKSRTGRWSCKSVFRGNVKDSYMEDDQIRITIQSNADDDCTEICIKLTAKELSQILTTGMIDAAWNA